MTVAHQKFYGASWEGLCETKMQRVLVGKYERMRLLRRFRHRVADDKKLDLKEVGCDGRDLIMWLRIGKSGRFL